MAGVGASPAARAARGCGGCDSTRSPSARMDATIGGKRPSPGMRLRRRCRQDTGGRQGGDRRRLSADVIGDAHAPQRSAVTRAAQSPARGRGSGERRVGSRARGNSWGTAKDAGAGLRVRREGRGTADGGASGQTYDDQNGARSCATARLAPPRPSPRTSTTACTPDPGRQVPQTDDTSSFERRLAREMCCATYLRGTPTVKRSQWPGPQTRPQSHPGPLPQVYAALV